MSGKRGKNDATDAAAICEAVTRLDMRFVPGGPCPGRYSPCFRKRAANMGAEACSV